MIDEAKNTISKWAESQNRNVELNLVVNNNKASDQFISFCNVLSNAAPNVIIKITKDGDAKEPFIKVNDNLLLKAIPDAKMLEAFLGILTFEKNAVPESLLNQLADFELPATLKIYTSPFCPFCPKVFSDVSQLAFTGKPIEIIVIDAGLFPELSEEDNIVSAPTVVYNEHFRWTGTVKPEDIAEVICNTKPESLSSGALRTLLETGKASVLSNLMIDAGIIFPAFYEIITHEKWPVRLGAMVVMEELIETAPSLAETAFSELWKKFSSYDDSVKGDIIYLTGETGNPDYLERIIKVINDNHPDELKEAAEEALENLK